jgi:hypothetical protein
MTHGKRPSGRSVTVPALARVEGEGGLEIVVRDGRVTDVRLDIYEPPRFFEAFLRGRQYTEPPDITSRICGICPIAYQMSSCQAIEDACAVEVPEPIAALRRLIYCGEWIESHTLHIYLLHAPDFLGYESGIHMARERPELLQRGLRLKKAGNQLMEVIGGRSVHPVNVRVGGLPGAGTERTARPHRTAGAGPPGCPGDRPLGRHLPVPRLRPRLHVRLAPPSRRIPDHPRAPRLQPGPRHHCPRIRPALHRNAGSALHRPALTAR